MKLLAIETATEACSAALWLEGALADRHELAPREHARLILPMMDGLLAEAGVRLADLDALAFGRGPGAFTGVRIAAAVIQGAAFGAGLPVVPVSTLAALAQQGLDRGNTRVLAALDARMGEVYWGAFEADAEGLAVPVGREQVIAPEAVPMPLGDGWYGIGSGWGAYGDALRTRLGGRLGGFDAASFPSAREVARLAVRDFAAGLAVSAEQALPVYLRDKVAEKPKS
ncbi:tRNA (adenosine(37)-N6)-threonylcarbamoyltransferase complex dimerization subunit type 1 TsaB [Thioalkalivibrio denitrificans]|uniref:tRNA threonylcarbamoyladenosine biosynthesis protein TsaB n=1 Tax=Thioalkalivibrio denitrificans TaxID=108003 RepID=A0A1V3N6M8_9GAMM|nr:tRNA (adenosine(37)-N6)-threonylcarbamoyltransferase complex dimerization subunit type 1 TsaB [Thioalkalivibrio denitrificans]OOG20623.1 tRNA (adenosine(37)-N6)-threonylcarbamoyltransferase complex dimerization subunit type 1 TsaB [Thioalkalivibrio denitrificans]